MKNFFQCKICNFFDRDSEKFEPHPRFFWAVIFIAEFSALLFVLGVNFFTYQYVRTDDSFKTEEKSVEGVEEKTELNRQGLREVVLLFEEKKSQFQNLTVSPIKIADPSLSVGVRTVNQGVVVPGKTETQKTKESAPVSVE
jgi:hypothetical protein